MDIVGAMFDLSQRHFGRFTRTAAENEAALTEASAALAEARDDDGTVEAEVSLGEALTIAGREREALAILGPAVSRARSESSAVLGWAVLMLATAEHYADLPADASPHFDEALRIARATSRTRSSSTTACTISGGSWWTRVSVPPAGKRSPNVS